MLRFLGTVALGLVIAVGATAQDASAPLADTKKELQELRDRQKGSVGPELKDGLRQDIPLPGGTLGTGATPPRPSMESLERERKQREKARQNWLINGMSRLEKDAKDGAGRRETDAVVSPEAPDDADAQGKVDPSDPAYLLKLYDQQKKRQDTKAAESESLAAQARPVDPLAPFLQGWLAGSPVRDQALSNTTRTSASTGQNLPSGLTGGPAGFRGPDTAGPATRPPAETGAARNPYLQDPAATPGGAPLLSNPSELSVRQPVEPAAPAQLTPANRPPAVAVPEAAPASRRAAPPPPTDDKKYFPQLKKF